MDSIRKLSSMDHSELMNESKQLGAPFESVLQIAESGRLPVANFAAGGVATPADAALMMQLGADGVFVGSGIFKSEDPDLRARAIVEGVSHYRDPDILARVSKGLGKAMPGIELDTLAEAERMAVRGW